MESTKPNPYRSYQERLNKLIYNCEIVRRSVTSMKTSLEKEKCPLDVTTSLEQHHPIFKGMFTVLDIVVKDLNDLCESASKLQQDHHLLLDQRADLSSVE